MVRLIQRWMFRTVHYKLPKTLAFAEQVDAMLKTARGYICLRAKQRVSKTAAPYLLPYAMIQSRIRSSKTTLHSPKPLTRRIQRIDQWSRTTLFKPSSHSPHTPQYPERRIRICAITQNLAPPTHSFTHTIPRLNQSAQPKTANLNLPHPALQNLDLSPHAHLSTRGGSTKGLNLSLQTDGEIKSQEIFHLDKKGFWSRSRFVYWSPLEKVPCARYKNACL